MSPVPQRESSGGAASRAADRLASRGRGTTSDPGRERNGPSAGVRAAGLLAVLATGVALGLGATALVLSRGWDPGAVTVGAWTARPQVGTAAIDPYARAELARSGAVPLAASEGLAFVADTDDTGYRLLRTCRYRVSGAFPPARFWTLTATAADDTAPANPVARVAFTSTDVVRDIAGAAVVALGPTAVPGNWLPLAGTGPLVLTLRLYDTPLAGHPGEVRAARLPAVSRLSCQDAASRDGAIR